MGSLNSNDYEALEPDLDRSRMPTGLHTHPSTTPHHPTPPREALTGWLAAAEAPKIPELVRCAASIRHDAQAVRNGCMVIWSQGIVEGFNNQIKRLKRIMYGRARFDLLRKRILLS